MSEAEKPDSDPLKDGSTSADNKQNTPAQGEAGEVRHIPPPPPSAYTPQSDDATPNTGNQPPQVPDSPMIPPLFVGGSNTSSQFSPQGPPASAKVFWFSISFVFGFLGFMLLFILYLGAARSVRREVYKYGLIGAVCGVAVTMFVYTMVVGGDYNTVMQTLMTDPNMTSSSTAGGIF